MSHGCFYVRTEGNDSTSHTHSIYPFLFHQESQGKANHEPHRPSNRCDDCAPTPLQSNLSFQSPSCQLMRLLASLPTVIVTACATAMVVGALSAHPVYQWQVVALHGSDADDVDHMQRRIG